MGNAVYTRICEMCGATMENVGPTRRFCPSCIGKRAAEKMLAKHALQRELRLKEKLEQEKVEAEFMPKPRPKKPTADNSIDSVCARAIASGRTYGQQVEFERRQKELKDRGEIDQK